MFDSAQYIPVIAALGAVIGLVLMAGQLAKFTQHSRNRGQGNAIGQTSLSVIDTLPIDRNRRLHVIRWQGQDLLLLTGGPSDRLITATPAPDNQS